MKKNIFIAVLTAILLFTTAYAVEVPEGKWYSDYVTYCVENNAFDLGENFFEGAVATKYQVLSSIYGKADISELIEKGAINTAEEAEAFATREYAAIALANEFELINNLSYLPDVSCTDYSYPALKSLYNAGILTGKDSDGTFSPEEYITVEELCAMVARLKNPDLRVKAEFPKGYSVNDVLTAQSDSMTDIDKEVKFTANTGYTVSKSLYDYLNSSVDETVSEEEKLEVLKTFVAASKIMSDYGYCISEENFIKLSSEYNANWDSIKDIIAEEGLSITKYSYGINYWTTTFYNNFYYEYMMNRTPSFDEVYKLYADKYVRAKHILIQFDGDTEESKANTFKKAKEVHALAIAENADFDALIKEYGEDPGMTYYTDGYVFTVGEIVPEFETAAFALNENEISAPVETSYGYHIIQRLDLTEEIFMADPELIYSISMYHAGASFEKEFLDILDNITFAE